MKIEDPNMVPLLDGTSGLIIDVGLLELEAFLSIGCD